MHESSVTQDSSSEQNKDDVVSNGHTDERPDKTLESQSKLLGKRESTTIDSKL